MKVRFTEADDILRIKEKGMTIALSFASEPQALAETSRLCTFLRVRGNHHTKPSCVSGAVTTQKVNKLEKSHRRCARCITGHISTYPPNLALHKKFSRT
jgi:hypothetical protein